MVFKKLGEELTPEFLQVVEYLGASERMHVVVEPAVYKQHIEHRWAGGGRAAAGAGRPQAARRTRCPAAG
jgi:hypothetical protein